MYIHPLITAIIKPVTGCKKKQFPHGKSLKPKLLPLEPYFKIRDDHADNKDL
jgi:hypothetical protein